MSLPSPTVAAQDCQLNWQWLSTNVYSGLGTPEAVVTAKVGALYLRQDGGAGTTLYVKEADSGENTGWAAK